MKSLRGRLRAVLALALLSCWVGGVGLLVTYTANSERSLWDSKLQAFGTKILLVIPAKKIESKTIGPRRQLPDGIDAQADNFTFQVWYGRESMLIRTPGAPDQPFVPQFTDGFHSNSINGVKWRIYALTDRTGQISVQVANLQSALDAEMQREALLALLMLSTVLLLLGVLLDRALILSLRPIASLESAMAQRQRFDLAPLPASQLPQELQPLVLGFNRLLKELDGAIDAERRFIGDAAHELRTPLSALQVQAEVALHATNTQDKDAALRQLLEVARRSSRLADQMLDLARVDAGTKRDRSGIVQLDRLVAHVASEYAVHAELQQRLLVTDCRPCSIAGDIDEIAILLRNLADNALRFAPQGGEVRISCAPGPVVELRVADNGPGVPESEHLAIFQRFHRASGNRGRGSGIGLSMVAAIARLHNAAIATGAGLHGRGFGISIRFPAAGSETIEVAEADGAAGGAIHQRAVLDGAAVAGSAEVQEHVVVRA